MDNKSFKLLRNTKNLTEMNGGIVVWKLEMKRSHFSGPETVTSDIFGYLGWKDWGQ